MKTIPFKYEKITPEDKYLLQINNPPKVKIKFHKNLIEIIVLYLVIVDQI